MFGKPRKKTAIELEQQAITTVVGVDMKITGNIQGNSAIRIDGTVEGDVTAKTGIILGEKSSVNGNLNSDYLVIYGKLNGNIQAKGLYIKSTGAINGDITVEIIEIELGGRYNGKLNMQHNVSPD